jgi:hypothetical protein
MNDWNLDAPADAAAPDMFLFQSIRFRAKSVLCRRVGIATAVE